MGAGMYFNKNMEVSADTMRRLRYEGLSNHQIAKQCGCSEATVYRYIGKKSLDVMNAAMTNKPSPVKNESAVMLPMKQEIVSAPKPAPFSIMPSNTILSKSAEATTIKKEEPPMENPAPVTKKVNDRKKLDSAVIDKIQELHDKGYSNVAITKELGISSSSVSRYLIQYNLTKGVGASVEAKVPSPSKVKMKLVTTAKGELCDYKIDLSSGSIDIDGILKGILDKETIDTVIEELTQIRSIVMG